MDRRDTDTDTDKWDRGQTLLRLYDLMMELSDEHNSDGALIEKRDGETIAIVLEYNLPPHIVDPESDP